MHQHAIETKDLYNIDERLLKNYIPHKMPMMLLLKYIRAILFHPCPITDFH